MPDLATIPLEDLLSEIRRRRELIESVEAEAETRDQWRAVARAVAKAFNVPPASLWRQDRKVVTTQARQAAMVLMREKLGMTLQAIAEVFRKDHGTVVHAIQTQSARMLENKYRLAFQTAVATIYDHAG